MFNVGGPKFVTVLESCPFCFHNFHRIAAKKNHECKVIRRNRSPLRMYMYVCIYDKLSYASNGTFS